jgi:trigger factor
MLLTLSITALAGCGSSGKTTSDGITSTGSKPLEDAVYTNDSISLATYEGLSAEKKVYTVTDEALQEALDEALSDYTEYPSVDRASQKGDWIDADYTASILGTVSDEQENYYFVIGEEEFGEEFDAHLTGVSAGDTLEFTIAYDDDYEDADWAGLNVDFSVTINDVEEEVKPECTDEFVRESLGYDDYETFVAITRASLEENYESESDDDLRDDLLQQVIDASVLLQYSQEDYDNAYAEVKSFYESYADMFGVDIDEIYDSFDIDEDALESDAMDMLTRNLVIAAIEENEGLTADSISDEDFESGVAYYMEENDYSSRDDFLADYGEDAIRSQLLENAVLDLLVEKANVTEVEAEYEG